MSDNVEKITFIIDNISFSSEESGFAAVNAHNEENIDVKLVGTLAMLRVGEKILANGQFKFSEKWGEQFCVKEFEYVKVSGTTEIIALLSSGIIKGIREKTAQRIVDTFGEDTINILDNYPQRLIEVPKLTQKSINNITKYWYEGREIRELTRFLYPYGIAMPFIYRLQKIYGDKAKAIISQNPYQLIEDMHGVGFFKADKIAQAIGFTDTYRRTRAAIIHILREAENDGNAYLPKPQLIQKTAILVKENETTISFSLDFLKNEEVVIEYENDVYLKNLWLIETECAELVQKRIDESKNNNEKLTKEIAEWAEKECKNRKIIANSEQISAVIQAAQSKMFILTGGPGTGKTTTVKMIVDWFKSKNKSIVLSAPTGRAAQRITEISGENAKTIHRLLEYQKGRFTKNNDNPLDGDVFIIDEMSMVDLRLATAFLRAVPDCAHIIFVGDTNQLPSVGVGAVLENLIKSQKVGHIVLKKVFRQAEQSRIVTSAHEICNGTLPKYKNSAEDNCFFIQKETPTEVFETIVDLVCRRLPNSYGFDPKNDIQVITPMHKGDVGTIAMNRELQNKINGKNPSIAFGNRFFATGDKVMQTKNNYSKSVFNGDMGEIIGIDDDILKVRFLNNQIVEYDVFETQDLTHGYCITIHKSQGCEFPAIIVPLVTQHYTMLRRKNIYTALTRAKKICIFVGTYKALAIAVNNYIENIRFGHLADFILKSPPQKCKIKNLREVLLFDIED
ncbi:MAG: ATP-dependent RecD-like DNA helicase [Chitinispirillales bacterium]|jgi:exodeoxyribonuclease V alpha subunit|nr:ATP-dependent RecD-like DNA helicase [Chitinispirillales bacterium]